MIRALVTGSLYGPPQARTSQAGKPYVTAKVRADCADSDVWEPAVLNAAARLSDRDRTIGNILADIGMPTERQDRRAQTRVSNILRANGYQRKRGRDTTGGRGYLWLKLSPISIEGGQKGDTGLASEIAAVPSVPICPPQEKNNISEPKSAEEGAAAKYKNDEVAKIKVIENEGDNGGQGTRWGTNTRPPAPAPRADDDLSSQHRPVDPPKPSRNAPLPATATADAGELWNVLKLYRGWETPARLASKLAWPQSRLTTAAQELQEFGRAEVKSGGWIRPVGEVVA